MILKTLSLLTAVSFMINPAIGINDKDVKQNKITSNVVIPSDANVDSYKASDGSIHNVLWLPNVDAPKMPSNEQEIGQPGYFYKNSFTDSFNNYYEIYEAPMENFHGYFDLNKDVVARPIENSQCYLAAASNMLSYWMQENENYIRQYMANIQNGVYGQEPNLIKLMPLNQKLWEGLLKEPEIQQIESFKGQLLAFNTISKEALSPYYFRGDGYWPDRVIDFFINGYNRWEKGDGDFQNNEDNYVKDPFGGYFAPLFGKKMLTKRYNSSSFELYNELIAKHLLNGDALSLTYLNNANVAGAHAITLWGAEYDENNVIQRVFVTDSDDFDNNVIGSNSDHARGLHAWDIFPDENGVALISTNTSHTKGAHLNGLYVLDNSKELFKARLNDTSKPLDAKINTQPKDILNAWHSSNPQILSINAESIDNGYLTYQWYKALTINGQATLIKGATNNTFTPDTETLGDAYYYCEITNHKNGYLKTSKTNYAKVTTIDEPLIDAATPNVSFDTSGLSYSLFDTPKEMKVRANVSDGGTLTYQWFFRSWGDSSATGGTKITGATSNVLKPYTNNVGRFFYYCEVTNTNLDVNGRQSVTVNTRFSKMITIKDVSEPRKSALQFAYDFLNVNICGTDDNTPADSIKFLSFKPKFDQLSKESQDIFKNTKGNQYSKDIIEQVVAKYDRIISLYGKDQVNFPDFMSRLDSEFFTNLNKKEELNITYSSNITIALSIAFASFTIISIFILMFKKKIKNN